MHHFLIVHAKTRESRDRLLDRLRSGVEHLVPYEPHIKKLLKVSEDIFFVSTESHDFLGLGQKNELTGSELTAFEGFCFLKDKSQSTLDKFKTLFSTLSLYDINDHVNGEFCAISVSGERGRIKAISDFTGLRPLYYLNNSDYFAVSNRQMFLNPLLTPSGKSDVDWEQIADLLAKGNKFTKKSLFRGVELIRPGFAIDYSPASGVEMRRSGTPVFTARGEPSRGDYIRSVADIIHNFDSLDYMPGLDGAPIRISLTGGEDSRLVLAAALESRIAGRIEAFTYGFPDNPDIAAAEIVAQKAGVPHVKTIHTPPTAAIERPIDHIWTDLRKHAFRYEGAPGAWDGGAATAKQVRLDVVGYFDAYFKRVRPSSAALDITSRDAAHQFMQEPQQSYDPMAILRPEAIQRDYELNDEWLESVLAEGAELNDIPELYYFDFRLPWWGGGMAANAGTLYRLAPLASKFASRTGLKQSLTDRRERKFIFEAMLTLRPDLLEVPYLNKKWPSHFQSRSPYVKLPGVELQLPTPQHPSAPWQVTLAKKGGGFVKDYFYSHDFGGLDDVIDVRRLMSFLDDPAKVNNTPIVRTIANLCEIMILSAGEQSRAPDKIENSRLPNIGLVTNMPELAPGSTPSRPEVKTSDLRTQKFDIKFPGVPIRNVRIDPATSPSKMVLREISIKLAGEIILPVDLSTLRANRDLIMSPRADGALDLDVIGSDPHIYLPQAADRSGQIGCSVTLQLPVDSGRLEVFFDQGAGYTREHMVMIDY